MSNLLYYPYINLPKTNWSIRALLYYDNIGTIVPTQYFREPEYFDPFMREVMQQELINLINPMDILEHPWDISDLFLNYLGANPKTIDNRRSLFTHHRNPIHYAKSAYWSHPTKIHADKFDSYILNQLIQIGLAVRESDNWYIVENRTANELMSYLASVLASKINYIPATDKLDNQFINIPYIKNQDIELRIRRYKRDLILKELIPYPKHIDLYNLRRFKDLHYDLLNRFNNKVEQIVLSPDITPESPLFQTILDDMKADKEELSARMRESHLGDIIFGTICGTLSAGIGFFENPALGAGLGLLNAIHTARMIERPEDITDQTGLKYIALIDKRLRRKA